MSWGWWDSKHETPIIAVVINTTDGYNTHTGIAFKKDDNSSDMSLIHLAFHCDLRIEDDFDPRSTEYHCLVPNLPSYLQELVATRCRAVANARPNINYGFAMTRDCEFNQYGHFVATDNRGLNCSTFVLTIFSSVQLQLVRDQEWQHRPDDNFRFRELWCMLLHKVRREYGGHTELRRIHEDWCRRIAPDVTSIRVRPEETAGACLAENLPVGFVDCQAYGQIVRSAIGCRPIG
jgi:hypothetical protein